MLTHQTIEKLQALHLTAMATAFDHQRSSSAHAELPFEDRFGLLVDTEWTRLTIASSRLISAGDATGGWRGFGHCGLRVAPVLRGGRPA